MIKNSVGCYGLFSLRISSGRQLPWHTWFVLLITAGVAHAQGVPFREEVSLPGVGGVTSVNVGDINRDGRLDLVVFEGGKHNQGRNKIWIFENRRIPSGPSRG